MKFGLSLRAVSGHQRCGVDTSGKKVRVKSVAAVDPKSAAENRRILFLPSSVTLSRDA